ncbi:MAG: RluA family pseudouridine synthase [Rhodobacterales bacterium]
MSKVQMIEVDSDGDGQRLDRWLRKQFPELSQVRIEKMCRKGELRVDKGRAKASRRLEQGQTVRVPPIGRVVYEDQDKPEYRITDADAAMIQSCVIYKDDDIIVLNKPAGLAVQGGTKTARHVDGLSEALKFGNEAKPKLVHRLDRDTSGVLLLARSGKAAQGLAKAFQSRDTRKIYWAAVAGVARPKLGTIRFGLVKAGGAGAEKMYCVHPKDIESTKGAKRATTDYATIQELGRRVTWMALVPITGRTHQLRAHMAEIGNPIIGDGKYGGSGQSNEGDGWGAQLGGEISRKLHLHARSITFAHPITGQNMHFVADMPDHMKRTWDFLGWDLSEAPADPFEEA